MVQLWCALADQSSYLPGVTLDSDHHLLSLSAHGVARQARIMKQTAEENDVVAHIARVEPDFVDVALWYRPEVPKEQRLEVGLRAGGLDSLGLGHAAPTRPVERPRRTMSVDRACG